MEQLLLRFPAFGVRNYRLFFFGQSISFIGNALQTSILGWHVFILSNSAEWVGIVISLPFVAPLLLLWIAGAVVERFSKRGVLYITQGVEVVLSGTLAYLSYTEHIQVWQIAAITLLSGITSAFDRPAQRALQFQIAHEHIASAAQINSLMIGMSGMVGGLVAIALMAYTTHIAWAYLLNCASFVAALFFLWMMQLNAVEDKRSVGNTWHTMAEGFQYIWKTPTLFSLVLLIGLIMFLGYAYKGLFPVVAKEMFNGGAGLSAAFLGALTFGGFMGGVYLARLPKDYIQHDSWLEAYVLRGMSIFGWAQIACALVVLFEPMHVLPLVLMVLAIAGGGTIVATVTVESVLMSRTDPAHLSRVGSYLGMAFNLGMCGGWAIGYLAEQFKVAPVLCAMGSCAIAFAYALRRYVHSVDGYGTELSVHCPE